MKNVVLNLPTFAFVVGTRAVFAGGLSLLLSDKLPAARRRALGAAMVVLGAATTIPAAISVLRSFRQSSVERDKRLIGATRFPRKGDDDGM